ncbi:hypothetical protein, partial [Streptomyces niveiscabiei]|uniref:hypothetical protein n=1 Tax=Streptomyces niveiscabiei TaxID=164115 RepID=UPI0038F7A412
PLMNSKGEVDMNHVTEVCQTLVHELCHDTDSIGTGHPPEFYRAYHDDCMIALGPMVAEVVRYLNKYPYSELMERAKKKSGGVDADAPLTTPEEETE